MATTFSLQRNTQPGPNGEIVVIELDGFLDAHTAPDFEKAVQRELDGGNVRIIAECGKLTYISSAGLGVFMSFIEDIREAGGDLKICGLIPKVAQVFEILGFDSMFEILPTLEDAVQKFGSPVKDA